MVNENGIVRIKEREFSEFYGALNGVSEIYGIPVQHVFEAWLHAVLGGMTSQEIEDDLLEIASELVD